MYNAKPRRAAPPNGGACPAGHPNHAEKKIEINIENQKDINAQKKIEIHIEENLEIKAEDQVEIQAAMRAA